MSASRLSTKERPPKLTGGQITIRLTDSQARYVLRNAKEVSTTAADVIRFLIDKGIAAVEER